MATVRKKKPSRRRGAGECTAVPAAPKAARGAGRPRALSPAQQKSVQLIYAVQMSMDVRESYASKISYRMNGKRLIQVLAKAVGVSERVIVDVIRQRGAYKHSGFPLVAIKIAKLKLELKDLAIKIKGLDPTWTPPDELST